jgi:hypothetical protein
MRGGLAADLPSVLLPYQSREKTREFVDVCALWVRAFNAAAAKVEVTLFDQDDGDNASNPCCCDVAFSRSVAQTCRSEVVNSATAVRHTKHKMSNRSAAGRPHAQNRMTKTATLPKT